MKLRLVLATGREKSVLLSHPWGFSGALSPLEGHRRVGVTSCEFSLA
ncbi:23S rRNA m(5)C1962 methyltransferase [Escherichia coli]|nr:23S rRNA m(5)C1962 methyltransferase [Escherichia coli]